MFNLYLVKTASRTPTCASSAGTNEPTWARIAIKATYEGRCESCFGLPLTTWTTWLTWSLINNNYSISPSWIWSDKITNERVARVGYNHFIFNKGEWNNCFSKFSNQVLPPIFISTILQSVRKKNLAHYFPCDVKLRLLAHSRSFLANQKARNAIVGAENLLTKNSWVNLLIHSLRFVPSFVRSSVYFPICSFGRSLVQACRHAAWGREGVQV